MGDRFYCPEARSDGEISLWGDEAKHLARVLRVKEGGVVEVFDGRGYATLAEVVGVEKGRVRLRAAGPPLPDRAAPVSLTLATAVPKGDRFDWLVEKATELGVARLIPVLTERSVVDPRLSKLDRARRAVIEVSKQCGRQRLMEIAEPLGWAALLAASAPGPEAVRLVCHPGARAYARRPAAGDLAAVAVAVGPEGGFTAGEVEAAVAAGWTPAGLGATLLRVETAGLVACARVIGLYEE